MPIRPSDLLRPIAPVRDQVEVDVKLPATLPRPVTSPDQWTDPAVKPPSTRIPSITLDPLRPPKLPPFRPPTEPIRPPPPAERPPIWDGVGMIPPTFRMEFPDGLRRAPRLDDITIQWGLDNRTPDEVAKLVRSNFSGAVHQQNEGFIERSVPKTHRAFTVAVNNAFTPNSPFQAFRAQLPPDAEFTMLGTLAADLHPTLVRVKFPQEAEPRLYELTPDGYQQRSNVSYPIIMETPLQFDPDRVAPSYPSWTMAQLATPLTTVFEPS